MIYHDLSQNCTRVITTLHVWLENHVGLDLFVLRFPSFHLGAWHAALVSDGALRLRSYGIREASEIAINISQKIDSLKKQNKRMKKNERKRREENKKGIKKEIRKESA